ncbi:nucleotide pyrophosphohydrolase [Mucilaginibacter aquatilis]|uniref:Nucleotide pyrophosphohydrolase n=1 Tax=Mucilaginibacter aquatilis TaxID=1517760 RepID=A0A6I4I8U3_9SPHI|nr:nucleotide pyrophosphohydrolase [Mucilaginibacter aquatilis]MVN91452.1 nucleotide pyrophosphohydrolase [Mucilaginibacter aquatilis]
MSEIQEIIQQLIKFRDERDWQQFHNSKDLSLAISIEAGELLELFLWKQNEDVDPQRLKEELADILSFCFLLAEKHQLSVPEIIKEKIAENDIKYPASKARGNAKKYTEL